VLGGLGAVQLARWLRGRGIAAFFAPAVLIGWMAVSGALAHPDYLSYFNEFAGDRPDRIVVDSDLDWRQDLVLLGRRLRELRAPAVWLDLDPYGFPNADIYQSLYDLPPIQPEAADAPAGWHAIGLTALRAKAPAGGSPLPWYVHRRPVERLGGMLLFRVY
jgi:hypothetical protein